MPPPPYLTGVYTVREKLTDTSRFPFSLPFLPTLDLTFSSAVTFFVGENGTGKSTLLEAIAALCRLPVSGGGRHEIEAGHGPDQDSELSYVLRTRLKKVPKDGFFLRAELQANLASLIDSRGSHRRWGGRSLHTRSHGEGMMAIVSNRLDQGLYLLDEPESALSPTRQLELLSLLRDMVRRQAQFVIATHSPILMTYPGAVILNFNDPQLRPVLLEETGHYQVTRRLLLSPESYWRHFNREEE
jgi:predicted ATPase